MKAICLNPFEYIATCYTCEMLAVRSAVSDRSVRMGAGALVGRSLQLKVQVGAGAFRYRYVQNLAAHSFRFHLSAHTFSESRSFGGVSAQGCRFTKMIGRAQPFRQNLA